jgi:hypothetical protein
MKRGLVKKLCGDNLKYGLSNVIRPAFDKGEYTRRRQLSFKNIYQLHDENMELEGKCNNLYVVLYSKYFTQRFIIQETEGIHFGLENDETLKQSFKEMLKKKYASKIQFDNAYLNIIKELRKDDEQFTKFKELHERIDSFTMGKEEMELFFVASSNTDVFLEKKLSEDINKFKSRNEKILHLLDRYKFVNGWLTAGGIWSIGIFGPTLEKIKN